MTKTDLARIAASYQGPITRVSKGARAYGEREMYLRTEATDRELNEARIEADLARRQSRQSEATFAETRVGQMLADRTVRMKY